MMWCQHGCHSGKEQEVYNAVRTTRWEKGEEADRYWEKRGGGTTDTGKKGREADRHWGKKGRRQTDTEKMG